MIKTKPLTLVTPLLEITEKNHRVIPSSAQSGRYMNRLAEVSLIPKTLLKKADTEIYSWYYAMSFVTHYVITRKIKSLLEDQIITS